MFIYEMNKHLHFFKYKTQTFPGDLGKAIGANMAQREAKLFDSDLLMAAFYADVRYRILLEVSNLFAYFSRMKYQLYALFKGGQMARAERAFADMAVRIRRLRNGEEELPSPTKSTSSSSDQVSYARIRFIFFL